MGSEGTVVTCTRCGAANPETAKFCTSCGNPLAPGNPAPAAAPQAPPPPAAYPPPGYPYAPTPAYYTPVCPSCRSPYLQYFHNGKGICTMCKYIFRWGYMPTGQIFLMYDDGL